MGHKTTIKQVNKLIKKIIFSFQYFYCFMVTTHLGYIQLSYSIILLEQLNLNSGYKSPIQYFIGFVINLIINNIHITYWIVVGLGFVYVVYSKQFK